MHAYEYNYIKGGKKYENKKQLDFSNGYVFKFFTTDERIRKKLYGRSRSNVHIPNRNERRYGHGGFWM